ncbi:small G protein signaling modulator 1-like isoform X1 [Polyodon spathula]|uniref:small G protein signaling modulator 1-like isoform X1 n=1 Tax=Polyodon spathula TaxID=7913 RepID=UPI001B7EC306|nr:small G protein signaling modulator 1-like isoform X1 [Polyodon spathula]
MATAMAEAETRQKLLRTVKKEVKQIMEEAVTRKFVHEDSSHIVSFCAAVEACVLHGLKRRAAGFLRSNKIAALFMKVGKSFPLADELCRKAQELEQIIESKRNQIPLNPDSTRKLQKLPSVSPQVIKHLWIRTALIEKVLDKIVHYLVENSSKFYEKEAVLMDPVDGPILASLLVGPCALEYTKMKTADHFWTDPSADELVQRHRIHSGHCRQDSPTKRPALCIQKRHSSGSMDDRLSPSARDYVESLHQNSRATLLFGKNNVLVQPKDDMEAIPGYLSLHQTADIMTLKWTPNQLMNGSVGDLDYEKSVYWDYAMTIRLEEIVYLHCHQLVDSGGTVVLVSQDGIQRPPLRFPKGGHLLQFLSCLENGLLPRGQLDPPLWSQRGKGKVFPKLRNRSPHGSPESVSDKEEEEATDYVFRILFPGSQSEFVTIIHCRHHHHPRPSPSSLSRSLSLNLRKLPPRRVPAGRILVIPKHSSSFSGRSSQTPAPNPSRTRHGLSQDLMDQGAALWHPTARKSSCSSCSQNGSSDAGPPNDCNRERAPLKLLCDNMKYQIISRAFYGWFAYCRHMSTVRTHLSALVNHTIVDRDVPHEAGGGLTAEMWQKYLQDCKVYEEQELLRLVYFGGVEPTIRREVWPFLLGHYQFGMSENDRKEVDDQMRACYEQTMSEWLGCEAIVRQREKEQHAAALAKCSSGASLDSTMQKMMHHDSTVSNESSQSCSSDRQSHARLQSDSSSSTQVFESAEEMEQIETEVRAEESVKAAKRPNGTAPNGTCSPDSGHPSSRNFSITSGFSDRSFSTEDSGAGTESAVKTSGQQPPQAPTKQKQEGASPSKKTPVQGIEDAARGQATEETVPPVSKGAAEQTRPDSLTTNASSEDLLSATELPSEEGPLPGVVAGLPMLEMQLDEEAEKQSLVGSEDNLSEEPEMESLFPQFVSLAVGAEGKTEATSPVTSIGVTYSQELLDMYTINLHRIEKDVQRCDRNYWYFTPANLEKLRNIMCSYIWQHLEIGYVQGMCDLLAPLLVILDDEAMAFSCFTELMKRMNHNFPHGGDMDTHFANMRSLIQILDSELFELMHQNGDYTHFYFCYRWFLLDFKRELVYDDVFSVWETIWAAKHTSSTHFVLFIALAMVEMYRDIILENNMDFTDIIKFFNEMAEHHNSKRVLTLARDLVYKVQTLIENK